MIAKNMRGEGITLAALFILALALFGLPLGRLAGVALIGPDGGVDLAPLGAAIGNVSVQRALWHSFQSAFLSALGAGVIGTALGLVIGLTDLRAKGATVFLLLLPMMIPPHVTAIAWIQALGPGSPLLQAFGIAPAPGSAHPLYSAFGVIFLLTLQHMPLVLLVVLAALRSLPREVSEAARISGARPIGVLRRIILPLLGPALLTGFALAFVSALGNFGIPALLGIPARYTTLPVLIWRRLSSFGPTVLTDMAVISALVAALAVLALLVQMTVQARMRAELSGPPQPPLRIRLGPARGWVQGGVAAYVVATLALPMAALVATALVKTYGLRLSWATLTFDNFAEVLLRQQVTLRAFANSTLTAGVAAGVLALISAVLGYFATRRGHWAPRRLAGLIGGLADVSYAIPGLVISVAFILAYLRPLPLLDVSIYNTLWIIGLAYLTAFFAVALKPVTSAYRSLDPSLDDAARVSGAGFFRRLWRIFLPLVAPAAASGAILVFLTAYNEVTVSALLWSTGTETIGTTIFNYEDGGYTTLAAAMATVTVAATLVLMVLLDVAGRKLPAGVVPWRITP